MSSRIGRGEADWLRIKLDKSAGVLEMERGEGTHSRNVLPTSHMYMMSSERALNVRHIISRRLTAHRGGKVAGYF
jgi:hypothetical protein